jgi:hypothetical protein
MHHCKRRRVNRRNEYRNSVTRRARSSVAMNSLGFRNRNPLARNSRTFRARNERGYDRRAGVAGNFERKCRRRTLEKLSKAMNLAVELEQMGRLCAGLVSCGAAAKRRIQVHGQPRGLRRGPVSASFLNANELYARYFMQCSLRAPRALRERLSSS